MQWHSDAESADSTSSSGSAPPLERYVILFTAIYCLIKGSFERTSGLGNLSPKVNCSAMGKEGKGKARIGKQREKRRERTRKRSTRAPEGVRDSSGVVAQL